MPRRFGARRGSGPTMRYRDSKSATLVPVHSAAHNVPCVRRKRRCNPVRPAWAAHVRAGRGHVWATSTAQRGSGLCVSMKTILTVIRLGSALGYLNRTFIASSAARAAFVFAGSRGAGTIRFGGSSSGPCTSTFRVSLNRQAQPSRDVMANNVWLHIADGRLEARFEGSGVTAFQRLLQP